MVNTQYWLLSRWEDDSDEAVNCSLSFSNAQRSGISQIAVFADACRASAPDDASVDGSSIFPKSVKSASAGKLPQWDHFLAARLGGSAQEVSATDSAKAYGIFTRCVMRALSGAAEGAITDRPPRVVTSETLADYLEKAVPLESGETVGANVQAPEVSAAWRSPKDIYLELTAPDAGGQSRLRDRLEEPRFQDLKTVGKPRHDFSDFKDFSKSRASEDFRAQKSQFSKQAREAVAKAELRNERAANEIEALFAASQGREGFETGHGLTLIGCEAVAVTVRRGEQANLFKENSMPNIRGHGEKPLSILIELDNGNWIAGCILPEFVGTIVIKDGLAASVNYAPARHGSFPYESFEHIAPMLNRWTALMHQGRFGNYKQLEQIAGQFQKYKHINPSLGIIAAYAYERRGDLPEIDKVASYFAQAQQPVPFDVALLSTKPVRRTKQGLTVELEAGRRAVAGSFPLMTQGWSFLDREDDFVPSALFEVRTGLLPALWTTFRGKEGKKLAELLYQEAI